MKIAITGANGYIGRRLIHAAGKAGFSVVALSRTPVVGNDVIWAPYDLRDANKVTLPSETNIVCHLAATTRSDQKLPVDEVAAADNLIAAAREVGACFVFLSSQAASKDAPTEYGRVKWRIEQTTLVSGGWVIRAGQVYGGPEKGLFGTLCSYVRRYPAGPFFIPALHVQPVHVDDLADAILGCTFRTAPSLLSVGMITPIDFSFFLRTIARERFSKNLIPIPVPVMLIALVHGFTQRTKFGGGHVARLASLAALPAMKTREDLDRLAITLRPLPEAMSRSGFVRRRLLREGRTLISYILRKRSPTAVVKRYVRAIESQCNSRALSLPELMHYAPAMVAVLEKIGRLHSIDRNQFVWRLDAAVVIAESSPEGASRFLAVSGRLGRLKAIKAMGLAILLEFTARLISLILRPIAGDSNKKD